MTELREMIFRTADGYLTPKEFETWLYAQDDLADRMSEELILELFSFNYNRKDARYEFKSVLNYFEKEAFLLWKVKTNLNDLVYKRDTSERIVNDFYWLADELPFLRGLGYYLYEFDNVPFVNTEIANSLERLSAEASNLLNRIQLEESKNSDFKLTEFKGIDSEEFSAQVGAKEWWKFWK